MGQYFDLISRILLVCFIFITRHFINYVYILAILTFLEIAVSRIAELVSAYRCRRIGAS